MDGGSNPSRRPRPPARTMRNWLRNGGSGVQWWRSWLRKYVIACLVCGGLSVCHGIVFIVLYLLLRSYTSSLQFFETMPTYVPGIVFIITGLILMCFAKRKNRYAFLLKMAGGCCLVCALLCVVITVTTTVVHMNRLQTLHECVYTPQAKTCMCISAIGDHNAQEAHRFVFNHTPNCEVVHGSLYSCLRALFSFSVLGILLCIACSMLIYQLLSHEKKRLYWEQLELRRRFLYQRHSHHSVCGCYDWPLWDMLDYRLLAAQPMVNGDECAQPSSCPSGTQNSVCNWLPWPRPQAEGNGNETCRPNLLSRLMSRDVAWNQQATARPPEEPCGISDSMGSLPWRSECIHIFRTNHRNTNCFPPFGIRPRSSPYGRPHGGGHHRRTRSNDGVFHHLHMNPAHRYPQPYSLVDACHMSEIPPYLWGPPPPYSQPSSMENVALYAETELRSRAAIEISRCNRVLEIEGGDSVSSKVSTPLSERRFVCHNFSSDGITLTIGGEFSALEEHKKEENCIVEVHVPYIFHKKDFNTLPARSGRKSGNPFKSLSNIPLALSFAGLMKAEKSSDQLSVIKACCDLPQERNEDPGTKVWRSRGIKSLSSQLFCDGPSFSVSVETDNSLGFDTTLVEAPSEFKSSLVTVTTPSTPVAETFTRNKMCAQSLPNLSLPGCSTSLHSRQLAPSSSANTSTSQDLADFDFDDGSSLLLCSPVSDVLSSSNDDDSSASYPPCPPPFRNDPPFSNESSCEVKAPILLGKRPLTDCPINCGIRHLHHYNPDRVETRRLDDQKAFSRDRNNFIVTIKSVNV